MALVVAFVAAVGSGETPLNVLQLLWVNLIMDSLGALGERCCDAVEDAFDPRSADNTGPVLVSTCCCPVPASCAYPAASRLLSGGSHCSRCVCSPSGSPFADQHSAHREADVFLLPAAALATEEPTPDLLLQKPAGRRESLINGHMWWHIVTQGFYQMFWLFLILYGLPVFFSDYELPSQGSTAPGYLSYAGVMTERLPANLIIAGARTFCCRSIC